MAKWGEIKCPRCAELEAQITAMEEGLTAVHMAGYMDGQKAAEAKLAKAVEALRGWIDFANEEGMPVLLSDLEAAELTSSEAATKEGGNHE